MQRADLEIEWHDVVEIRNTVAALMFDGAPTRMTDGSYPHSRMQPKRNTASVFDLTLGNYSISGASICSSRDGIKFTFTIGPVTDGTVAALDGVARKRGRLYLYCYGSPLLFDLVSLERKEPNKVRLVMRRIDDGTSIAAA